ncbi:hypothetical protein DTO212C5_8589 [Paecilomyces variotii]|nr:hypothetical protein DTO212C5_8589 [Paecilomyces variotii]
MVLQNPSFGKTESEDIAAGRFLFISSQALDKANGQITRRLARSHAVKQALETKRRLQEKSKDNFRITTTKDKPKRFVRRKRDTETPAVSLFSLSEGALDPFQTLAADSSRLRILLSNDKVKRAPEPVFSTAEQLSFQSFHSVFQTGLVDPALLNAVMLSFAFEIAGGYMDRECLLYQGQAIGYLREKMNSPDEAASEPTIGTILLLAGVEARLGMKSQAQLHLGAVQRLLEISQTKPVDLTGGIKRAIFWQDLNSSVLIGSRRIVDHETFVELHWTRDLLPSNFFRLSPGFKKRSHIFTKEFIEVLEDIYALQCIRETASVIVSMAQINNQTASIQSRLMGLSTISPILECCHLAAYLCTVMLCCTAWCALVIPPHVSSQLLHKLQQTNNDIIWDNHPELLLWILYIGGAFAPAGIRIHNRGKGVCAHARSCASVKLCAHAGVDVIYHASYVDEEGLDLLEARKDQVFVAPAINFPLTSCTGEATPYGLTPEMAAKKGLKSEVEIASRAMNEMRKRGIKVLPGGDFGFAWARHGTYARDLAHFVNLFGYTPMEAIISATAWGGEIMGHAEELGKVLPGYYADVILVNGNPLEDIEVLQNTEYIHAIMINGHVHKNIPVREQVPWEAHPTTLPVLNKDGSVDWKMEKRLHNAIAI